MTRKIIALLGGGYKPFTKGHYMLVKEASNEADEVRLFVSTSSRIRKGQIPIVWNGQMDIIWNLYLSKIMPNNVIIDPVKNPLQAIWLTLENADADQDNLNTYLLFGGAKDLHAYFPLIKIEKSFPRLLNNYQIEFRPYNRSIVKNNISATTLRKSIVDRDMKTFINGLPAPVRPNAKEIFDILSPGKNGFEVK